MQEDQTLQKDQLFGQRKEMKKKAHAVVRSHYFGMIFLMLIMILFGTEYGISLAGWGKPGDNASETSAEEEGPGSVLDARNVLTADSVFDDIVSGRLKEGISKSEILSEELENSEGASGALGMSSGILAQVVGSLYSGKLFTRLAQTILTITNSQGAVTLFFIIGSFLLYWLVFFLLKNVYSAVIRRMYLEARVYKVVPFTDVLHFVSVHRWLNVCWVMFMEYVYSTLWSLTIIGGVIKYFSYFAVPYIAAENPAASAKEVITLSRKMMDGHKIELLKFKITMWGWVLLGLVTMGISDMLYGSAYRLACESEYYAKLREEAIRNQVDGVGILTDPYLFEKADRILLYETYFEVVDEITLLHENRIVLTGWRKKIADWFGVWFGSLKEKKAYDDQEGRTYALTRYKRSMAGETYPQWLCPHWPQKSLDRKKSQFSFLRNYTVWTLFLLFITFCFIGWTWEVALHFMQTGEFANRGTLHGPWLPIYGCGGIIVLILCSHFRKNPVLEFFTAVVLCGILEYTSAWYLEQKYHVRWWSYDGYFLNLHGRICAEGLLVFGVGCCAVVYLAAPLFDYLIAMLNHRLMIVICAVLFVLYFSDVFYSGQHPNMAKGAVEESAETVLETETG